MQCSRCGQVNADDARYCTKCELALAPSFAAREGGFPAAMPDGNGRAADVATLVPLPASPASPPQNSRASSAIPFQAPSAIPFQAPQPVSPSSGGAVPVSQNAPYQAPSSQHTSSQNTSARRQRENARGMRRSQAAMTFACRLCGGPVPGNRFACPLCDAPHGMIANPNDGTGATYFAAGALYPPPTDSIEALMPRPLPPAIAAMRWSWGAFGASTLWLFAHPRLPGWGCVTLLLLLLMPLASLGPVYLLIPAAGLLVSLLAGLQGNALAWQFGKYPDVETFQRMERRWAGIGILSAIGKTVLLALLIWFAFTNR